MCYEGAVVGGGTESTGMSEFMKVNRENKIESLRNLCSGVVGRRGFHRLNLARGAAPDTILR